jgi:hypothetical protein
MFLPSLMRRNISVGVRSNIGGVGCLELYATEQAILQRLPLRVCCVLTINMRSLPDCCLLYCFDGIVSFLRAALPAGGCSGCASLAGLTGTGAA